MIYKIKIEPHGKVITSRGNESIKTALENAGFYFPMNCGGAGTCSNCRIEFISPAPKMRREEIQMFGKDSPFRMSCMHLVDGDYEISLPMMTEIINLKTISDIHIEGGKSGYGVAIDLGTTTVAVYLVNLQSGVIVAQQSYLNPQNALAGDVVSRLKIASEKRGLQKLHTLICDSIANMLKEIIHKYDLSKDMIGQVSIAGNTVMTHFFLGVSTSGLDRLPFSSTLQNYGWLSFDPEMIGLSLECRCRLFPVLYGFIGGDTGAAILACSQDRQKGTSLLVDLGTNGEISLAIDGELYATSAAAGPAFDGMGMHSGMPALNGAIEGISKQGQLKIIGDEKAQGICGSGYISLLAFMLENKLINYSGLMEIAAGQAPYWNPKQGNQKVKITQDDIRKFQLAKGAIAAGIDLLCHEASITHQQLDKVMITGSFGNRIDVQAAVRTGLIPKISRKKIQFIDNAAGRGAVLSLGNSEFYDRMLEVKRNLKVINLGDHPKFQETFIENMLFAAAAD